MAVDIPSAAITIVHKQFRKTAGIFFVKVQRAVSQLDSGEYMRNPTATRGEHHATRMLLNLITTSSC
jgi:hypothetical protein